MNRYEIIFIGRQDLSQQQMEALGVSLGLAVTQNSGKVVRSEYCGFRSLAYTIKKNQKGHYYAIHAECDAKFIKQLENNMRLNEDIIRYLVVKVEEFEAREHLITQAKMFNDESGGGYVKDSGYRNTNDRVVDFVKPSDNSATVEA